MIHDHIYPTLQLTLIFGTKYSRMDLVKHVEDSLYPGFLGPFLNTLSHLTLRLKRISSKKNDLNAHVEDAKGTVMQII